MTRRRASTVFPTMTDVVPEGERGDCRVEHFDVSRAEAQLAVIQGQQIMREGRYCRLMQGRTLWMSDTDFERLTNYEVVREARGDVLLVGLGLGMAALACAEKKGVASVTALELSPDVVALVAPHIAQPNLRVVIGDGRAPPLHGRVFDVVYIDIWSDYSADTWENMRPLLRMYRRLVRPGGWCGAWSKDEIQRLAAEDRRRGW